MLHRSMFLPNWSHSPEFSQCRLIVPAKLGKWGNLKEWYVKSVEGWYGLSVRLMPARASVINRDATFFIRLLWYIPVSTKKGYYKYLVPGIITSLRYNQISIISGGFVWCDCALNTQPLRSYNYQTLKFNKAPPRLGSYPRVCERMRHDDNGRLGFNDENSRTKHEARKFIKTDLLSHWEWTGHESADAAWPKTWKVWMSWWEVTCG